MAPQALSVGQHVPAAARGDRDAFATLINATGSVVSAIALAIVRDVELSRDVAQDVFVAAWRDLAQLRDPNSFLPWIRQLTRHRAYHVLRSEKRRGHRISAGDSDVSIEQAVDPRPDARTQLLAAEERELLEAVLNELPDEAREVVTLYYREGESTAQVARLLGLSEAGVRQRLSRARARLRAELLEQFGETVRGSTPDATFTAAVLTALAVGAPAASSAATITAASSVTAPSLVMKAMALGGGAFLGAAGGIGGVLLGTRQLRRQARSAEELRAIKRFELYSLLIVMIAAALFPLSWYIGQESWTQIATFLGFLAALAGLHWYWLPRILRNRRELQALEDPVRAARARTVERRVAILGWALGIILGTLGLIAGLLTD